MVAKIVFKDGVDNPMERDIKGFAEYLRTHPGRGGKPRSSKTIANYVFYTRRFAEWLRRRGIEDFREASKRDVEEFVLGFKSTRYRWGKGGSCVRSKSEASWGTRNLIVAVLRVLYAYLYRDEEGEPEQVKDLNRLRVRLRPEEMSRVKSPSQLLTEEEVIKMLVACERAKTPLRAKRDRALIGLLYEGGLRIGELLSLKVGDCIPTDYGFKVYVTRSKTNRRAVPVIGTSKYLAEWLSVHPLREDRDAPLFVTVYGGHKPMSEMAVRSVITEVARKAGIKKRVYPHLFRHSRMTKLAGCVTEAYLRRLAGWTKNSYMPAIYIHLSERDVEREVLRIYGFEEKAEEKILLREYVCPYCGERNPPHLLFCQKCGRPLRPESILRELEEAEKVNAQIRELKERVKALEELVREAKETFDFLVRSGLIPRPFALERKPMDVKVALDYVKKHGLRGLPE